MSMLQQWKNMYYVLVRRNQDGTEVVISTDSRPDGLCDDASNLNRTVGDNEDDPVYGVTSRSPKRPGRAS